MSGRRPGLAIAALGVHAALAVLIVGVSAAPFAAVLVALRGPVVFAADVPSVAWLAPPLVAALLLLARLLRFAQERPARVAGTWALLIVLGAALLGRAVEPPLGTRSWTSALDAPPTAQTVEALKRMREAAQQSLAAGHGIPEDAAWLAAASVDGRPIHPAYLYAGLRRRDFHLVRIPNATGPVEDVLPGDLAGTLYAAVSADRQHFWLSAVVLLDEGGYRTSAMLPGPAGVAVLSNVPRS